MSKKTPPDPPPVCKNFNIRQRKYNNLNQNYVDFDFRMSSVLVIFSFFSTHNITPKKFK